MTEPPLPPLIDLMHSGSKPQIPSNLKKVVDGDQSTAQVYSLMQGRPYPVTS